MAEALAKLGRAPGQAAEPVDAAVTRARWELAEIEAALRGAAAVVEAAEHAAEDALRRAGGGGR
jgi:adenylosuccinate lyase